MNKLLLAVGLVVVLGAVFLTTVAMVFEYSLTGGEPSHTTQCFALPSCAIVFAATTLEYHLEGAYLREYPTDSTGQPSDPLLQPIFKNWLEPICGGYLCDDIHTGSFQCVSFIKAAFYLVGIELTDHPDAITWWDHYATKPDWQEIWASPYVAQSQRGLPEPGDIIIWNGDAAGRPAGHIAIVIGVQAPTATGQEGWVEVAQANGPGNRFGDAPWPGNYYTMPLRPDDTVLTWQGYYVVGYLRLQRWPDLSPTNLPDQTNPNYPYVGMAANAARETGIPPAWFLAQMRAESNFDPAAKSPAGAEGIAQFLPSMAAELGIDPLDPTQALPAAVKYMAAKNVEFSGDYAAALAAYNAGSAPVNDCKLGHDPAWLACMSPPVQQYVLSILFYPHSAVVLS